MKNVINKLIGSSFVRNVAIMATGTAGAQAITMILSPIITRLYGPEAFGTLGTFTALTRVIIPIAALTYPIAIVLPKSDKNAKSLVKISIYLTLLMAVLATILLFLLKNYIVALFNLEDIAQFLYLIPLVIIFSGFMKIIEQWLIRTNQFSINAKATFLQSFITNGSKIGIGFLYPTAVVLVILQTVGNGIKAILMLWFNKNSDYRSLNEDQEKQLTIKELAKKHKDFPLYRAPEEFFSSISQNLPILLLTSFFGPAAAGFYNIGRTVLALPSRLIGQSIGDVFYPRITQAANNGENVSRLIVKATIGLALVGIIPFGTVMAFGPYLFELVFGSGWVTAGEYARWIALFSFSAFMIKPSVRSMPVLSAQRFHLIFTIFRLIVRSSALILGFVIFKSDIVAVAFFGVASAFVNILLILITIYISNNKFKSRA